MSFKFWYNVAKETIENRRKIVDNINERILSLIDNEIKSCFFKEMTSTYDAEIIELKDKKFIKKFVVIDAFNPKKKRKRYFLEEIFADFLNLNLNSHDSIRAFVSKHGILNNFCITEESKYKSFLLAKKNYFSHLYIIDTHKRKAWKLSAPNLSAFGIRGKPKYIGDFFYRNVSPLIGRNLYIGELIDTIQRDSDKMFFQIYSKSKTNLSEALEFSWKDLQNYARRFYEKIKNNSKKNIDILNDFPFNLFLTHFGGYLAYEELGLTNFNVSIGNKFIDAVLEMFSKEIIGMKIKICQNPSCKKFFVPKSSKARFCSENCRDLFHKRKKRNTKNN